MKITTADKVIENAASVHAFEYTSVKMLIINPVMTARLDLSALTGSELNISVLPTIAIRIITAMANTESSAIIITARTDNGRFTLRLRSIRISDIPEGIVYTAPTATAARTFCPRLPLTAHGRCPAKYDILDMARQ